MFNDYNFCSPEWSNYVFDKIRGIILSSVSKYCIVIKEHEIITDEKKIMVDNKSIYIVVH